MQLKTAEFNYRSQKKRKKNLQKPILLISALSPISVVYLPVYTSPSCFFFFNLFDFLYHILKKVKGKHFVFSYLFPISRIPFLNYREEEKTSPFNLSKYVFPNSLNSDISKALQCFQIRINSSLAKNSKCKRLYLSAARLNVFMHTYIQILAAYTLLMLKGWQQ